jgi:hypothetical protein
MFRGRPDFNVPSVTFSDIPDDLDENELYLLLMEKLGATTIIPVINTEARELVLSGFDRGQRNF